MFSVRTQARAVYAKANEMALHNVRPTCTADPSDSHTAMFSFGLTVTLAVVLGNLLGHGFSALLLLLQSRGFVL